MAIGETAAVQTGPGRGAGAIAADLPDQTAALAAPRLPGLPGRNVEKAIGRVADASKRLSLPAPQTREPEADLPRYRKVMSERYGFSGDFFVDRELLQTFNKVMTSLRHPRDFSTIDAIYSTSVHGAKLDRYGGKNTMYLGRESPPELWIKTLSARPDDEPAYQAWLAADPLNAARGNGALIQLSSSGMERLRAALALVQHPIDFAKVTQIGGTQTYALSSMDDRGVMRLVDGAPPAALIAALSKDPDAEPAYQAYLREHPLTREQQREQGTIDSDRYSKSFAQRHGFRGNLRFESETLARFKKVMASVQYPRDFSTIDSISAWDSDRVESERAHGRHSVYLGTATAPEHWIKVLSARPDDEPAYRAWLAADPLNVARVNGAYIRLTGEEHRRVRAALALVKHPIDFAKVSQVRSTSSYAVSFTDERGGVNLVEGAAPEAMIAALSRDPDAEPAYRAYLQEHPLSEKQRREVEHNALVRYRESFSQRYAYRGGLYVGDALERFKEAMASIQHPRDFSTIDVISTSGGDGASIRDVGGKRTINLGKDSPPQVWIKALSARPEDEPAYRDWLAEDPLNAARANGATIRLSAEELGRVRAALAMVKHPIDLAKVSLMQSAAYSISSIDAYGVVRLVEGAAAEELIPALSTNPDAEPAYQAYLLAHPPTKEQRARGRGRSPWATAGETPIPLDPWTARRKQALADLDERFGNDANWAAARGVILNADPVVGLPVIERALRDWSSDGLHKAVHHLSTSKPWDALGSRWDARCGAHLGTECARTSVVTSGQAASFRFGHSMEHDAPATWHSVHVDDQVIPVLTPVTETAGGGMTLETLTQALAMLPKDVRQHIGVLAVEPRAPKTRPNVVGFTRASDQVISLVASGRNMNKPENVAGVLVHEVGHRVAFELLGGDTDGPRWAEWKKASALDGASVSDYAEETWHEHFGETYAAWRGARGTPFEASVRARFKNTFAILDRIVDKSTGAAFNPDDPKHYMYSVRVSSAQLADTGDGSGPGEVYYQIHGGQRSDVVRAAAGERINYSKDAPNVRVIEGSRLEGQQVKIDFYDSDGIFDDHLGTAQVPVPIDARSGPQRLELKTNKGDPVVLEISAWPSRRPTRRAD